MNQLYDETRTSHFFSTPAAAQTAAPHSSSNTRLKQQQYTSLPVRRNRL